MKILLDLKPLQGESSFHGIGRATLELSKRLVRKIDKPIGLLSNINVKKGIEVKKFLMSVAPNTDFEVLFLEDFTTCFDIYYKKRSVNAFLPYELTLEWKISQINPDIFFIFSFFESEHPTSIKKLKNRWLNFIIAYDIIPYLFQDLYLKDEHVRAWYLYKLEEFKKGDFFFAISEQTKKDLIEHLNIPEEKIRVIPLGCDEIFRPLQEKERLNARLELKNWNINGDFILYVPGSFDPRKNIEGLIKGYSLLHKPLKEKYKLVIASKFDDISLKRLKDYAKNYNVEKNIVFTGYVSEETLVKLYNLCSLFVHPSYYEGFGLPVLEAAKCGAPVICSGNSALKDIIQLKDALFDPYNTEEIVKKISLALTDPNFRKLLIENSKKQAERFSWDKAVDIILEVMEEQRYEK